MATYRRSHLIAMILIVIGLSGCVPLLMGDNDEDVSNVIEGTFVLSASDPIVTMTVDVMADGELRSAAESLDVQAVVIPLDVNPHPTEVVVTTTDREGSDLVHFELLSPGPERVQVQWTMAAIFEGGVLDGPGFVELTADVPPSTTPVAPILSWDPASNYRGNGRPRRAYVGGFEVTVPSQQSRLSVVMPTPLETGARWGSSLRVAVADFDVALGVGERTALPVPDSCIDFPCTFEVWAAVSEVPNLRPALQFFDDNASGISAAVLTTDFVVTRRSFELDPVQVEGGVTVQFDFDLQIAPTAAGQATATDHMYLRIEVDQEQDAVSSDAPVSSRFDVYCGRVSSRKIIDAERPGDCSEYAAAVRLEELAEGSGTARISLVVEYMSFQEVDLDALELDVALGEPHFSACIDESDPRCS